MSVEVHSQRQLPTSSWRQLIDALWLDADLIVDRSVARLLAAPGYRRMTADEIRGGVRLNVRLVLDQLRDAPSGQPPQRGLAACADLGGQRARQGAAVTDLVHGWRVGSDEVTRRARELVDPSPDADTLLLQLYERILGWLDVGLVAA